MLDILHSNVNFIYQLYRENVISLCLQIHLLAINTTVREFASPEISNHFYMLIGFLSLQVMNLLIETNANGATPWISLVHFANVSFCKNMHKVNGISALRRKLVAFFFIYDFRLATLK